MRVLVATTAGGGHLGPLVPFANACQRVGHEVLVAAPASFAAAVERAGFAHRPFADVPQAELDAVFTTLPGLSPDEASARFVGEVFARLDARAALPGLRALVEAWRPDVIVREPYEFASYVVAERYEVPHVQVCAGLAWFEQWWLPLIEQPLTELRASIGLPGDPGLEGLRAAPHLTLLPASLEDPRAPGPAHMRRFRDGTAGAGGVVLPDWWASSADPLVYVTLGSVAAGRGLFPDLYRAVVEAVSGLPIRVLVTVGDAGDPAALEPLPANVHVERWWPQAEVMPHAAAMVGHGGFGTTLLGLAAGVPMVVVPLFADQPHNARRVAAVGAGVTLEGGPAAVGALAEAVRRVLEEPSYRVAARRIADEVRALPDVTEAAPLLERVGAT